MIATNVAAGIAMLNATSPTTTGAGPPTTRKPTQQSTRVAGSSEAASSIQRIWAWARGSVAAA